MKEMSMLGVAFGGIMTVWIGYGVIFESGLETPPHTVVEQQGTYSIREYQTFTMASTTTQAGQEGLSNGFRQLAGYIFGNNSESRKMSMTAPVMHNNLPNQRQMSFLMPSKWPIEQLPTPNSAAVSIEQFSAGQFAVISFRGSAKQKKIDKKLQQLRTWVVKNNRVAAEDVVVAQYNSPWVFPPLRRNEIWLRLTNEQDSPQ